MQHREGLLARQQLQRRLVARRLVQGQIGAAGRALQRALRISAQADMRPGDD